MPAELVRRVLESAPADVVLIGGQALAYWMGHYGIQAPDNAAPAISRDVDFFTPDSTNTSPLVQFAQAIHGRPEVREGPGLSVLMGSAIAPAEEGRIYNVDLLHDVVGLKRGSIEANAVRVPVPGTTVMFRVLHPLDVLQSRNANLHTLAEKQDETGQLQLRLAIQVASRWLEDQIGAIARDEGAEEDHHRAIFDAIHAVSEYSTQDAARKNARRYGIHLADSIPAWLIRSKVFWKKQWPFLRDRMSPAHVAKCEAGRA